MDIYTCISKYRSEIMGFATIMVLLFHQYAVYDSVVLEVFSHIGYWGVDIFLFVSGFGIAHSLSQNTWSVFFLNRVKKVLPICLTIGLFNFFLNIMHNEIDWKNLIPKLLCLDNWYIYTICIYYAISPYVLKMMRWKEWVLPTVVLILSLIISIFSLFQTILESTHFLVNKLPWAWDRIFVYLLGIYMYLKKPNYSAFLYIIGGILLVIMLLSQYGFLTMNYCHLQVLAFCIPFVCYVISLLCCFFYIEKTLCFFGRHSLSIFLLHLIVYSYGESRMSLIPNNEFRLFMEIVIAITLATIIDLAIDKFLVFFMCKHEK